MLKIREILVFFSIIFLQLAVNLFLKIGLGWLKYVQAVTGRGAASYQVGNTSSHMITEVKQRWARLVLG